MFVPLSDSNPIREIRFQYVTVGLIVINVIVFLLQTQMPISAGVLASFSVIPLELFGGEAAMFPEFNENAIAVPERYTLLSYMFLHADWFHLIGNMLFLWVFGDNVEDAVGHFRFLVFYLLCGVGGGMLHAYMLPESQVPLIGASGAVAGVIAAYLMLHPRVRVWVLAFQFIPLQVTAALALGIWVATQIAMVIIPQVGPVAWWAHIGGLIVGAALIIFIRKKEFPLFDCGADSA